jgi:branched-subunit amino acid permease
VLHAVSSFPTFTVTLAPLAAVVGAVLAVVDAGLRFRRPGSGSAIAILELVLGLLLFVATFRPVHPFVSTSIPVLYLAVPLEVVLIALLLLRSSRKGGLIWLTVATVVVNGLTAVLALLRVH